jgi:hypothetical protein
MNVHAHTGGRKAGGNIQDMSGEMTHTASDRNDYGE